MGSVALPFSNNAPQPIPGGYGNPTGIMPGQSKQSMGTAFPQFNAFGPMTTPSANQGAFGATDFAGLSSGFGKAGLNALTPETGGNLLRELDRAYGKGNGQLLFSMLTKGLFNPQVAAAFMNSMQPGIARGQADILGAFGAGGNRFGSSAALGLGDYMSQVNLNQEQTLAQMFQHSQDQELSILQGILPTMHQEEANNGGGWFSKIMGGLAPLASLIPGVGPFLGAGMKGIGSIFGGGGASSGALGGGGFSDLATLLKGLGTGDQSGLSPSEISSIYGGPSEVPTITSSLPDLLGMQAGSIWGPDQNAGNMGQGLALPGYMN